MNKYDNITLPEELKSDKHFRAYMKYNMDGTLAAMFKRAVDKRDGREQVIVDGQPATRPVFYGEWARVPQEEIDRINAENAKNKKIKALNRELLREQEIEEMQRLLDALKASVKNDSELSADLDDFGDLDDLGGIYEE